jgi:hypothetical protein
LSEDWPEEELPPCPCSIRFKRDILLYLLII